MIYNVYTIFDSAAKAYLQPFQVQNDGVAIRIFMDNVNSKDDNNISKHPEQFSLFRIAEFDDVKGEYKLLDSKKCLGNGLDFKEIDVVNDWFKSVSEKLDKLLER